MIALLLNKYVLGGVLVAAILAGCAFAYWHHGNVRYDAGIAAQQAADAKSLVAYTQARDAQLAASQESYRVEIAANQLHPISLPVVRLCINVSNGPRAHNHPASTVSSATAPAGVQPVPSGHPEVAGPDISGMLGAFGRRADKLSAQLRALEAAQ